MAPPADSKKRQGSSTSSSGAAKKPKDGVSKQEEVAPLTKNPWKPFTELTDEDLKLPLAISRYIRANGTDPEKFASDKETFDLRPWHGNEQDQFENVVARYFLWMIRLENRLAMKSYRSLFAKLMIFDMVPSMWPNTPGKVGHLTDDELNGRVGDVAKMTGEPTENVRKRLNKWSVMGSKLDVLCQLFGPGCLFFLKENLSNNFLNKRFTRTGDCFEQAIAHLRSLNLRERSEQCKANELAQNVRDFYAKDSNWVGEGISASEDKNVAGNYSKEG